MRHSTLTPALIAILILCAGAGGASAAKSHTPITAGLKSLRMSPQELRIRVRALIRPTLGIVEEAAERARTGTEDPQLRRGLLVWKIETTTTLLSAMLRNDPVLALADAWAYAQQQTSGFARPEVVAKFGAAAAGDATAAMNDVQAKFRAFLREIDAGIDAETLEGKIREWAEKNPIEGALYRRPSPDAAVAKALAESAGGGAFAALGSLEETTADVMTRMDLYTMYLPRLARWEGELAVDDLARGVAPDKLASDVGKIALAADHVSGLVAELPDLVDRQRAAAVEAIRAERVAVTRDVSSETRAVLDAVDRERVSTVTDVEAMVQRLLDRSGPPVNEAVRADLTELVANVELMRQRLLKDGEESLDHVVDRVFFRMVELLLIAAVLGAAALWVFARSRGR